MLWLKRIPLATYIPAKFKTSLTYLKLSGFTFKLLSVNLGCVSNLCSEIKTANHDILPLNLVKNLICCYRKFPKYSDTQIICCNHSKIWTMWLYHRVMSPNDENGMANSVDPDQTAPQIWVYTVCPGISVRKLRIITVFLFWPVHMHMNILPLPVKPV